MAGRPRDVRSRVVSSVDEQFHEVEGGATWDAEPRIDRSSLLRKRALLALPAVVLGVMVAFYLSEYNRSVPPEGAPAPPSQESPEEADPPPAPAVSGSGAAAPERFAAPAAMTPPTDAAGPGAATGGPTAGAAAPSPEAPHVRLVTLGYSATPRLRIAALMINGGLPVMLHEGESNRGIEISSILSDRVYFRYAGHTYVANLK
jgi:hypothetical protein